MDHMRKDRILGTIYGNCIGDAIGLLTEFMNKDEAKRYYEKHRGHLEYEHKVPDMHRARWENGDWTDDSDQMILIMQSIVECGGQVDYKDYGARLKTWARQGFPELGDYGGMGLGATTHHVLKHPRYDIDPHAASADVWEKSGRYVAPNGAAMRTSVLGAYQFNNIQRVIINAIDICRVTHHDPRCRATVVAITTAIALMLSGQYDEPNGEVNVKRVIDDSYQHAISVFIGSKTKKEQEEELKDFMYKSNVAELNLSEHGKIGYTYKALGAGFWALRQKDFEKALERIVFEAGDADSNGAVAGALLGCKVGANRLPRRWLDGLVHKKWLDEKIDKFLDFVFPKMGTAATEKDDPQKKIRILNMDDREKVDMASHPVHQPPDSSSAVTSARDEGHTRGSVHQSNPLQAKMNPGSTRTSGGQYANNPNMVTSSPGATVSGYDHYGGQRRSSSGSGHNVAAVGAYPGHEPMESSKEERRRHYKDHDMTSKQGGKPY